jgi:DNA-binding transcriptional LysR family regulator
MKDAPRGRADLTSLEVFVEVVDAGSLSAAARALGTSTSAVSKRISKLEEHLGVRLLERSSRHLAPTEPGWVFYERGQRVLAALDEAEMAVGRLADAPRGTLRVTAGVSFGERHLAPLVPAFLRAHPAIRVDLSLTDRFVHLLAEGRDVALRVGEPSDASLKARRLGESAMTVVASPTYLEARGTPAHPSELVRHECLRYALAAASREWRLSGDVPASIAARARFSCDHGGAMLAAVEAGLGLAVLPHFITGEALRAGRVVEVLREFRGAAFPVYALYPPGRHVLPTVRAFIDFLAAHLPPRLVEDAG